MTNSIMIIGAGPGIGQAVAEKFRREGWHVVLTARNAAVVREQDLFSMRDDEVTAVMARFPELLAREMELTFCTMTSPRP